MSLRVLIVDDSIMFRRALAEGLAGLEEVEVVGSVSTGKLALQRVRELQPDLVTLDLEMPEMDGLAVLDALRQAGETAAVIVISALTHHGGQLTLRALEKGAFDFITKPDFASAEQSREYLRRELRLRTRALSRRLEIRHILGRKAEGGTPTAALSANGTESPRVAPRAVAPLPVGRPEMVLIGVSTGGPNALARILPEIPATLGVPFLIVQHMPPIFTQSLAESLAAKCKIQVREAAHGDVPTANTAYIAPGGRHMRLARNPAGGLVLQITDDPPENNCKPAVDYLFRSVATTCAGRAMAVILTGMGSDGVLGLRLLKRQGCFVIAQDEPTCVVYGMPKAAVEAGVTDAVLPLPAIAPRITAAVRGDRT